MGCWNATCGISNLHIKANDEVYVFVLEQVKNVDSLCYSTAFYKPLLLPFYAEYNDYGDGEECSGPALPIIMESIKQQLVEMDVGENQCHDIAVKRDDFNEELFFEAIHENRLSIKGYRGETRLDMIMMRKDIIDHMFEHWVQRDYVGDGKGTCGYDNAYIQYKFQDILNDIPVFIERIQEYIKKDYDIGGVDVPLRLRYFDKFSNIFDWNDENKVAKYIRSDSHHFSRLVNIEQLIMEAIINDNIEYASQIIEEHMKAIYIECFLTSNRKSWLPGTHQGSQSQDHDGYKILISAMESAMTAEREQRE